jgi:hypothetical protein
MSSDYEYSDDEEDVDYSYDEMDTQDDGIVCPGLTPSLVPPTR